MPEYAEVLGSVHTIRRWWDSVSKARSSKTPLHLQDLWADPTKAEAAEALKVTTQCNADSSPAQLRAAQELVYCLEPDAVISRGTNNAQEFVYPRTCEGEPLSLETLRSLYFKNVYATPRTVVLDLGPMLLQVSVQRML